MPNKVLAGYGPVKSVKQITATKPFKQPSPQKTTNPAGHPARNLGQFLHPSGRGKDMHRTSTVSKPPERKYVPPGGDYKPTAALGKRTKEAPVTGTGMDTSDTNSEAMGSMMGPASLTSPPVSMRTKKVKSKQPMPFYGKMM